MKKHFDHAQIVEATLVSGYFNMWNRFTDALETDLEGDDQMTLFTKSAVIDRDVFAEFMNECWWAQEDTAREEKKHSPLPPVQERDLPSS